MSSNTQFFQSDAALSDRQEILADIIRSYEQLEATDTGAAADLRLSFLQEIKSAPNLLSQATYASFLANTIEPEDLAEIEWDSPNSMLSFSESLYKNRFEDNQLATRLNDHASILLRRALQQYEKEGEMEKMLELLRLAPSYLLRQDEELSRLHYRANTYEIRRVHRNRRFLYGYLLLQILLILFVFPFLFVNAENGRLQREVEQLTDVEIGDEGYQLLTYSEGLYWSVITAGSIGYGDITPNTDTGRIIAGILGTMGVITVGILAGLVLDRITPRSLP